MKKLFRNLMLVAVAALGMASCEDVPAPFVEPGGDEPEVPVVTEITCAEAVALCNELGDGATSSETYVITGYIVDVFANISNGQQSFWISDAKGGAKMVQAYWANLPAGVDAFKVGSQVKITGKLLKYVNASNVVVPEVKNADVEILSESGDEPVTPGTVVTCAEAATLCNALSDGASSEETYTITGYITDVFATVSKGQQSFWMADTKDGGKVIQAYWANLPEGVDAFKVGSQVKITGKLLKYVNPTSGVVVPEVKNATVEIISEGEGGGDEPVPGTAVSCAKAVELCNALADGATSEEAYTISGYITEIISAVSRNQQSFWMADTKDGGQVFQAYWANLPEGVDEFKAGSQVKITGKLMKYVNNSGEVVPEIKNATVEIVSEGEGGGNEGGGNEGGGDVPDGDNIFDNGDFELWENGAPLNWKSKSTAGNVAISQSTEAHNGMYAASMGYAASANKRMAYKEITLPAGTYKFCFYAKGTNTDASSKCQTRPGYVAILADGSADSQHYQYGEYAVLSATEWTLVEHEFTLDAETTICPVIMSPKNSSYHTAQNILVDDAMLVKIK